MNNIEAGPNVNAADNGGEEVGGGAELRWERGREVAVVRTWGEIDMASAPELRARLEDAVAADLAVIVDLSAATYMDSSGFGALLEAARVARPLGVTIYLAGCNPNVARMLEITRLATMFAMTATPDDARRAASMLTATTAAIPAAPAP